MKLLSLKENCRLQQHFVAFEITPIIRAADSELPHTLALGSTQVFLVDMRLCMKRPVLTKTS